MGCILVKLKQYKNEVKHLFSFFLSSQHMCIVFYICAYLKVMYKCLFKLSEKLMLEVEGGSVWTIPEFINFLSGWREQSDVLGVLNAFLLY